MDRRTLLKSAAILPAAAIVPAIPAIAEIETPAPVVPIQPVKLSPYKDYVWQWFVSHDGEVYYESFPTKEEAIQYAKESEYSIVSECQKQDFNLDVSGWWLVDHLNENNEELIGEGDGIECTHEQERDLEVMVQRAIEAWIVKHNIDITAWTFAGCENTVEIDNV